MQLRHCARSRANRASEQPGRVSLDLLCFLSLLLKGSAEQPEKSARQNRPQAIAVQHCDVTSRPAEACEADVQVQTVMEELYFCLPSGLLAGGWLSSSLPTSAYQFGCSITVRRQYA